MAREEKYFSKKHRRTVKKIFKEAKPHNSLAKKSSIEKHARPYSKNLV